MADSVRASDVTESLKSCITCMGSLFDVRISQHFTVWSYDAVISTVASSLNSTALILWLWA
eukprot:CAMPEP_0184973974 /NCGR_PEP_ID=MMETSP1098-20130426/5569_1 /TAXON_ID=89044 /ORGANISM="Spumella elongata, Strain CCAP 955/1" /LENGTH=60 /DNA_ID=CAMNT_0027496487 /DNA_START=82 /DNA_END=264 /DNA_ORIENTATION=+